MSDVPTRLRDEARAIRSTADAGLAGRVLASMPAGGMPTRPPLRFPILLAAAALLMIATAVAMVAGPRAAAPVRPVAMRMPAPLTLGEMLDGAQAGLPVTAINSELNALGADLTAVARTVRSAVPF